jgi:hypothetical protein
MYASLTIDTVFQSDLSVASSFGLGLDTYLLQFFLKPAIFALKSAHSLILPGAVGTLERGETKP